MKRNVNLGITLLLVASLLCFAAASIYYQTTYKSLFVDHKTKVSELQKVTNTLLQKKAELAETSAKQETLETKYTNLKDENDQLQDDKDSLEDTVSSQSDQIVNLKSDLEEVQALADSYKKDIENLERKIDDICEEAQAANVDPSDC